MRRALILISGVMLIAGASAATGDQGYVGAGHTVFAPDGGAYEIGFGSMWSANAPDGGSPTLHENGPTYLILPDGTMVDAGRSADATLDPSAPYTETHANVGSGATRTGSDAQVAGTSYGFVSAGPARIGYGGGCLTLDEPQSQPILCA